VDVSCAGQLTAAQSPTAEVVWHDLECGDYRADLALWHELAAAHPGPILEIGAGTGRVALELARAGHAVTALERAPALLEALRARTGADSVHTVRADARRFRLPASHYALCLVPMHTIQLFGGLAERACFLRCARATLRRGGLLACAVLARVEPFSFGENETGPAPETVLIDDMLYISRPTRVTLRRRTVEIERERSVVTLAASHLDAEHHPPLASQRPVQRDVTELQRLTARTLEREARAVGLRVEEARDVEATEDHIGSTVVMLRA
jgi:SAM-dependent methyltransferase